MDEINAKGGINGRMLKLFAEDGRCSTFISSNAVEKLVDVDNVKIILGGHCTPESVVTAKVAGKSTFVALASITSSPMFSGINPYFARTTWLSTQQAPAIADYAFDTAKITKMAVVSEQTDYARPIADNVKSEFVKRGGQIVDDESFAPNTSDFRSIITKIKASGAQAVDISAQSPDAALNFLKQIKELGMGNIKVFGNDVVNVQTNIDSDKEAFEGVMFASPDFDVNNPKTKAFIDAYSAKYKVTGIPAGILTAESYDAVYIIADALQKYGLDTEKIAAYIHGLNDFKGASGSITINQNGDGVRTYSMRVIRGGKVQDIQ